MKNIKKKMIDANKNMTQQELLNWSMNQLFRSARTFDLMFRKDADIIRDACDITAICILKNLVSTKDGYELVKKTNPKLLRGYRKPNI